MHDYVIINGKNSNTIAGLMISLLPPVSKPMIRTTAEEIDGKDGDEITKLGYSSYDKELKIGLYGNYNIDDVIAFFNAEGSIIFSSEPDKYYNFQILEQIDFEKLLKFRTATIIIHVQPFKYSVTESQITNETPILESEGSEITLDNTINATFNELTLKGNISQEIIEEVEGTEVNDTEIYIDDVDEDKESSVLLSGNTYQKTTTGKNLLSFNDFVSRTINGVTFSNNKDGSLTLNGTATATISVQISDIMNSLVAGTYTRSLTTSGTVTGDVRKIIFLRNGEGNAVQGFSSTNNTDTRNISVDYDYYYMYLYITEGVIFNNYVIKPMLEKGPTATDWEEYTNGASPNPNYPQNIEVVTGLVKEKIVGKNLFDISDFVRGTSYYVSNGNIETNNSTWSATNLIKVNSKEKYCINKAYVGQTTNFGVIYYDKDQKFLEGKSWNQLGYTTISESSNIVLTIPTGVEFIRIDFRNDSDFTLLQIEKGSISTEYEEYKSQSYEINLGKNLFNKDNALQGYNLNGNTGASYSNSSTSNYGVSEDIEVEPLKPYTVSNFTNNNLYFVFVYLDKDKNVLSISTTTTNAKSITKTMPANARYIRFNFLLSQINELQIEKGSNATSYSAYKTPIELCKINDYQDYFVKQNGNWYKNKVINKLILDGTETYSYDSSNKFFYTSHQGMLSNNTLALIKSNYFKGVSNNDRINSGDNVIYTYNNLIYLRNTPFNSIAELTAWLTTNNVDTYYVLATPILEEITDTELISQLTALYNAKLNSGVNNITTETENLLPYIDVKYNFVTPSPSPERESKVKVVTGYNKVVIENEDGTQSQEYEIDLGTIELCKIEDYQDYFLHDLNEDKWYINRIMSKVILNGSEAWSYDVTNLFFSSSSFSDYLRKNNIPYCNYYKGIINVTGGKKLNNNEIAFGNNISSNKLYIKNTSITSVSDFKSWLSTHNTTVYYPLATPILEEITDTELISQLNAIEKAQAYDGQTNISSEYVEGNIPFIIKASVNGSSSIKIVNSGNITSKPVFTIYGSGNLSVYLNNEQLFNINLGDEEYITLDIPNMEAYKDTTLKNRLVTGDYNNFQLKTGENIISFDGNITKVEISNYSRWL